ncbi:hypothetical protein ACFOPG_30820 [Couchioplanes caeruleus subsp. azureus]
MSRIVAVPAALLAVAAGVAVPAGSASAADERADVAVEITAKRNVLPAGGWSDIEVYVRNDGAVPAAGVTVALTLPPQLRASTSESTSDWECDWEHPVMSCTHVGDFAPGESTRVIRRTVEVQEAAPGDELVVSTSVTTSSPEASTGNNTASREIRIVDTGEVRGRLWNDLNADGVRQAGEPAATSVGLSIRSQDDEDQYGFSNNHNGTYRESVPVKRFKVLTELHRFNWRFTTPDVGGDDTDSDLRPVLETSESQYGETPVFMVDPATPTVVDLGVVAAYRPTKISPATAAQGSTTVVTLTGESFSTSLEPTLTRSGAEPVAGVITSVASDRKTMTVSFPLAQAAPGTWTLAIDRLYGPHAEVADAFVVTAPQVRATAAPTITGTLAVGSTVKATPGSWTPAVSSYVYQWSANGAAIRGATHASLPITAAMLGKRLKVTVTAQRTGSSPGAASSAESAAIVKGKAAKATKKPSITGTAKVGRTVRAAVGTWSPKADSYRYEWRLSGTVVRDATGATLKLTSSMRDKKLTVTVVARKAGHTDGKATSAAVKIRQ